jgi:hypothetical protein
MGNNGALTGITALTRTYPRCWMYFPAGAIAAGVPAAGTWYYVQMSSTTAGTVFNNTYTSGVPVVPSSPTAFSTTGPGAFTGVTGEVAGPTITVPVLGPSSQIDLFSIWAATNNANAKTDTIRFSGNAGTQFMAFAHASLASYADNRSILNAGSTASQIGFTSGGTGANFNGTGGAVITASVDTSVATSVVFALNKATATDNHILEAFSVKLLTDGT